MNELTEKSESVFKIGAVSKITNIPVDTLRIWERRYSVVVPIRSKNADRLYQSKDINRLTLLKMLVDRGHSIGTIARLDNQELDNRLTEHDKTSFGAKSNADSPIKVVAVGEVLSVQIQHADLSQSDFSFSKIYHNEEEFIKNNDSEAIDILVLEFPVVHEDHIVQIDRLFKQSGARQLILIYGFTNSAAKKLLDKTDYHYLQAPISIDNLRREVIDLVKEKNIIKDVDNDVKLKQKAPTRTYSNKNLIALSSASSVIKCECPQHLSSMIIKLVQFEHYSAECVERYDKDAELHSILGNMAGHARGILEQALTKIVEAENLTLDD